MVNDMITGGHVRVFTYKAFREFIEYHGFKIEGEYGLQYLTRHVIGKIDSLMSFFPSIASGMLFKCTKK